MTDRAELIAFLEGEAGTADFAHEREMFGKAADMLRADGESPAAPAEPVAEAEQAATTDAPAEPVAEAEQAATTDAPAEPATEAEQHAVTA